MRIVTIGSRSIVDLSRKNSLAKITKERNWLTAILRTYFYKPDQTMINGNRNNGVERACRAWVDAHNGRFTDSPPLTEWFFINLELYSLSKYAYYTGPSALNWEYSAGKHKLREMSVTADLCIAFWDGTSRGTRSTINYYLDQGISTHVFIYPKYTLTLEEERINPDGAAGNKN